MGDSFQGSTLSSNAAQPAVPDEVSALSIEAETGLVLFEYNADQIRPPASMIKLLLMLLVCEGLEDGKWTLDTQITASRGDVGRTPDPASLERRAQRREIAAMLGEQDLCPEGFHRWAPDRRMTSVVP